MSKDLDDWLYDLEHRHSQEIKLGLERVSKLSKDLGLTKPSCPVITVAGTNGKGSTVAMLEAFYNKAGFKVGVYTSPHLLSFTERIRINNKPIDEPTLIQNFEALDLERGDIPLTYFEFVTLAALKIFKALSLDILILEVGLGGRLDATNVIDADLAIITTIDYDHQDFLGDTLEKIGAEKAGIMKPHGLCIYADYHPPLSIIARARELNVNLLCLGQDFSVQENNHDLELTYPANQLNRFSSYHLHPHAIAAAFVAVKILKNHLSVSDDIIKHCISTTKLKGRLQLINGPISLLFDVAHNPQSVRRLASKIKSLNPKGRVIAVFSALKDKDLEGMLSPVTPLMDSFHLFKIDAKRAATLSLLEEVLIKQKVQKIYSHENAKKAFENARQEAQNGDMIVIFGSFYVVGSVMSAEYQALEERL